MNHRRWWWLLAAVAAGLILYRVLAPAEVSAVAKEQPPAPAPPPTGVVGRFAAAPLIVDSRVRVYVADRQVRADVPVDAHTARTPRWSFRRWPERLTGVVASGSTVVSRWSDGALVALDAGSGRVAWRAAGFAGSSVDMTPTGAEVVWSSVGLRAVGPTVVVSGGGRSVAVDAGTGRRLWEARCADGFTTAQRFVCAASGAGYDLRSGAAVSGWPAGPVQPLGCTPGGGCAGLRDAVGHAWIATGALPVRAPAADPPAAVLDVTGALVLSAAADTVVGDTVVADTVVADTVVARDPLSGVERWRWSGDGALLATQPGLVHLLSTGRDLVTLDARTGAVRARTLLRERPEEPLAWNPGPVYAAAGHVAVERRLAGGGPLNEAPVILAGVGRAP